MAKRIAVVVSQGQSNSPVKRGLEEDIVTELILESGIDVTVIPNLYDLTPDGTGMLALQGIKGNMVVLSWLFERGARWILDRNEICGELGESLLTADENEEDEDFDEPLEEEAKKRVLDQRDIPKRKIYCIDLRSETTATPFVEEIKRIANEHTTRVVGLTDWLDGEGGTPEQTARFLHPTNDTALGGNIPGDITGNAVGGEVNTVSPQPASGEEVAVVQRIDEGGTRRWYPVIDFSRCTNCMECIDFCLFGVYGVDAADTILVEQPDNCRKGCPACSRVCPENAIIFPQHKTPAIAGATVDVGSLKIDLSKLFGAPEEGKSAEEKAVSERDEQLVLAGREAVGVLGSETPGSEVLGSEALGPAPKRQAGKAETPKDNLDELIDQLDELDL